MPVPSAKTRTEQIKNAVEAAQATNQERDSEAAQEKAAPKEKVGMGRDDSDANKTRLLKDMEERAVAAEGQGNKAKAADIRARMKQLEEM